MYQINTYIRENPIQFNLLLLLLFLIWPFGGFILSLFTFPNRFSKLTIVLFWSIWGFTRILPYGHDSTAWTLEFIRYENISFLEFVSTKIRVLGIESTDFLYSLFLFLIRKLTASTALLWFILSGVFTYLYVKCYNIVLKKQQKFSIGQLILFFLFIFFIPKTAYGVRFWFATLILIYSITQIIINKNNRYLYLLFIIPLIHFSFIIPLFSFIFYRFSRKNKRSLLYLLFAIFFINILLIYTPLSRLFMDYDIINYKIEGYGNIDNRQNYYDSKSSFLIIDKFMYSIFSLYIILFMRKRDYLFQNNIFLKNYSYFLIVFFISILSMINFLDILDRFTIVFTLMAIIFISLIYTINYQLKRNRIILNKLIFAGIIFWGFHLIVNFLRSNTIINNSIYYSNFFKLISHGKDLPIIY